MEFENCIIKYWEGNPKRCKKYRDRLSPLFDKARDRITRDMLEVLNNRRYRNILNPIKRMRSAMQDPKMKQVSNIIMVTGVKSAEIINNSQDDVYNEEAPLQAECWTKSTPSSINFPVKDLTDSERKEITKIPYLGKTYNKHAKDYTDSALKAWNNSFMSVMVGRIQEVGKVAPDVQLVSDVRNTLDTMESRAKTVAENACINTARWIDKDFLIKSGQSEI